MHLSNRAFARYIPILPWCALFLGGLVYLFLRPSDILLYDWLRDLGLGPLISAVRPEQPAFLHRLPLWMVYALPGGMWAFAYTFLILKIWSDARHWIRYAWFSSIPLLTLGFELLQYPGIIPGTYHHTDLVFILLGLAAGAIAAFIHKTQIHHEINSA